MFTLDRFIKMILYEFSDALENDEKISPQCILCP